jgi:hypothetical protein
VSHLRQICTKEDKTNMNQINEKTDKMCLAVAANKKRASKSKKKGFAMEDFLTIVPKSEPTPETGTFFATCVIE